MSHIVTIPTQVKDPQAVAAGCRRLSLPEPAHGTATLFSGDATGLLVQLLGWMYPVVVEIASGQIRYDNYEGVWGEQAQLDRFLQAYAVEKTMLEGRKQGFPVTEQTLEDGSVLVEIIESA